MEADPDTLSEIEALVRETYRRLSTPGADPGELFAHDDMTVTGSGQGELMYGPEVVGQVSRTIASWGFTWKPDEIARLARRRRRLGPGPWRRDHPT